MDKEKIKKLHGTIKYLFVRAVCGICLICSWGVFFAYIMGGISLKLFLGYSIISAGLVYAMMDPIMYEKGENV